MEKRFVGFIVFSMAILLGFQALKSIVNPRPQIAQNEALAPAEDATVDEPAADDAEAAAEVSDDAEEFPSTASDNEVTSDTPPSDDASEVSAVAAESRRVAIGSLAPDSPYQMAVWFNSQGGAIECVALNHPTYTDLDDGTGYLGYLALSDEGGCRVNAVAAGTPAALATTTTTTNAQAGIQPDDLIRKFNDEPINNPDQLEEAISKTKPGDQATIVVLREQDGASQELTLTAKMTKRPLEVIRPETSATALGEVQHPLSYLLTLRQLGEHEAGYGEKEIAGLPSLLDANWETHVLETSEEPTVEFHYLLDNAALRPLKLQGPLRVIKRFRLVRVSDPEGDRLTDRSYHLKFEIELRNEGDQPLKTAYRLSGPTGLPLEGWWYSYKAGIRDVVVKAFDTKHKLFANPKILKYIEDNADSRDPAMTMFADQQPRVQYAGVDSVYFASALLADVDLAQPTAEEQKNSYLFDGAYAVAVGPKDEQKATRTDVSFRLDSRSKVIPPQESVTENFLIFVGPKETKVLEQYGLQDCISYGWFPLVSKPLLGILHAFHKVFRNYGISIILLTVLVRGAMYPIGMQMARNAQKMQELAPEMKRIAEQYKNDMEKRAAAQRELFRKHNYNPLSGCLPMLFQLPIFIGLYRGLSADIALRQAPLIPGISWCHNLAGPDQLLHWEDFAPSFLGFLTSPTGFLGPYLNILPLISVAFMIVHQKLFTPPPTDEQQEMQQKIMKYMMVFFGFMFFKVPAGLCIYFITSSAWGLAERKLLPKSKPATGTPQPSLLSRLTGKATDGANGSAREARRKRSKQKRR